MVTLADFNYTDNEDDVLAVIVNRLLASSLRSEYKNVMVLSGDVELEDGDTPLQLLDCDGVDRLVTMPVEDDVENHLFLITNASSGAEELTVKSNDESVTYAELLAGESVLLLPVGDGTWTVFFSGLAGVTDHGDLTGLTDDDHPQYMREFTLQVAIGNGVSAITTSTPIPDIEVPMNCTVQGWTLVADASGSIVIDVWKDTYANYPPSVADTIAGSEKPTLSSAQKNQDLALSTWTTSLTKGDWLKFNIDSTSTVKLVILSIRCVKA